MSMKTELTEATVCECGERMIVTVVEVINFDSIECPNCGSDVYHSEMQYQEALSLQCE